MNEPYYMTSANKYKQKELRWVMEEPPEEGYSYSVQISNGRGRKTRWMNIDEETLMKIYKIFGETDGHGE